MNSNPKKWLFTEEQRDDVCNGKLCPTCLGSDVKCVGAAPGMTELNMAFDCNACGEQWEGY